jgi:antirestriction protein ArdC
MLFGAGFGNFNLRVNKMSQSVFEIITNKIIEKLKIGVVPWRITWSNGLLMPRNGISKKLYRGINFFLLLLEGFDSPYWYTFNQVNSLGGRIKKGEKSSIILFWHMLEKEDEKNASKKIRFPILRFYRVFNALQCEGISPEALASEQSKIKECDELVFDYLNRESNLKVQNYRLNAFYVPDSDLINIPPIDKFNSKENYYLTYFQK